MIVFPNAKINLGLRVLRKRDDGFHELESIFYPVNWCDSLEILEAETFSFSAHGIEIPESGDNLCVKAYKALQTRFEIPPVRVELLKNIPIGAGLGGGSSDAAFMLKALTAKFKLDMSDVDQLELLAQLGSDCPFFWHNRPMIARGRGELLEPSSVNLSGYFVLIVYPQLHISTAEAYSSVRFNDSGISLIDALSRPVEQWKECVFNDFESHLFEAYPRLKSLKAQMYELGAVYAAMTGSGSSIFGIFRERPQCPQGWLGFAHRVLKLD